MQVITRSTLTFQLISAVFVAVTIAVVASEIGLMGWAAGALIFLIALWLIFRKPLRRYRALQQRFPESFRDWLEEKLPFYRALDDAGRKMFERNIKIYLAEQRFEAVGGAEATDENKLAVAAGAAMMLHGRPEWELPFNRTVLFYPSVFDDEYLTEDTEASFDGMVHSQGPIIISVRAMRQDFANPNSGNNVVLHELAHVLDFRVAAADGIPSMMDRGSEDAWMELVRRETARIKSGRSVLREYGASSVVEFFAVSVENFFERPAPLRRDHPELYEALRAMFNVDPLAIYRRIGTGDESELARA